MIPFKFRLILPWSHHFSQSEHLAFLQSKERGVPNAFFCVVSHFSVTCAATMLKSLYSSLKLSIEVQYENTKITNSNQFHGSYWKCKCVVNDNLEMGLVVGAIGTQGRLLLKDTG
jgi:hypothetical protein